MPPVRLGITRNVWAMGWTSLLNDASSELLYPILPLFLTITLGAPAQGTLFFAGEATVQDAQTGTVFGAFESGLRAAREVIES